VCSLFLVAAAVIASRSASARGQQMPAAEPLTIVDAA
jgi:hypothetical protein